MRLLILVLLYAQLGATIHPSRVNMACKQADVFDCGYIYIYIYCDYSTANLRGCATVNLGEPATGLRSVGDTGARALAKELVSTELTELYLTRQSIGDVGARALAEALPKSRLTKLRLDKNYIGDAGAHALAEALPKS